MGRLIDRGRRKGVKGQVVGVYSYPGFMARRVEGVTIAMQVGCPFFIKVCLILRKFFTLASISKKRAKSLTFFVEIGTKMKNFLRLSHL